jgi:hypothetical protein
MLADDLWRDRNRAQRDRLRALVARLSDDDLAQPLGGGWTVAAALAHLAFWDRFVLARWEEAVRTGAATPRVFADGLADLINEASLSQWLALDPRSAAREAIEAAELGDQRIEKIDPTMIDAAFASGRAALVERSIHRQAHLDDIERAVPSRLELGHS